MPWLTVPLGGIRIRIVAASRAPYPRVHNSIKSPHVPRVGDAADYAVPEYFTPMSTFQMGVGSGFGIGVPPENQCADLN